jgi:hypothetical protein
MKLKTNPLPLPKPGETPQRYVARVTSHLNLLSLNNAKMMKPLLESWPEVRTVDAALMLAPADTSGYQVCGDSTPGCRVGCVRYAGNGRFDVVQQAGIRRTRLFFENRGLFALMLGWDLYRLAELAGKLGALLVVRPNTFSDLPWERIKLWRGGVTLVQLAEAWGVRLYDYTKNRQRALRQPYPLTYSRTEYDRDASLQALALRGINVAVPFDKVPARFAGLEVIDGDSTDQRVDDPSGVVVGLKAKGPGRSDTTGFVVRGVAP